MNRAGKKRRLLIESIAVAIVLLGAAAARQVVLWKQRPMFSNTFARSEKGIMFRWVYSIPISDTEGNVEIADYHRNVLVVFLGDGNIMRDRRIRCMRFMYPHITHGGVTFPALNDEDNKVFFVPASTNKLFVFRADGTHAEFPLAAGEAERIHTLSANVTCPWNSSLVPTLERRYPTATDWARKGGQERARKGDRRAY